MPAHERSTNDSCVGSFADATSAAGSNFGVGFRGRCLDACGAVMLGIIPVPALTIFGMR